ncbi:MAG: alpha/beta fold hydrolase [Gemmatimonadota bacterium]|nr:alpha/beta fold hydrolase [Gemmatimonadota bacterium]
MPLRIWFLAASVLLASHTEAQSLAGTPGDYTIRDFRFASGETLPALKLHYRTLGTPRRDANGVVRNAVLVMHGTTGTGTQFLGASFANELFRAGQPLDTTQFYIILPDGIGHGLSSRPSEGLHARFPHYNYDDMVDADHRLLTEHLGVNHLRLVMGTSMGGMHSWTWAERYPDFMDAAVPLASVPTQIAGRNRMVRRMAMDDIRNDPEWKGGEYTTPPSGLRGSLQLLYMMTSAPLVQQRDAPTRDSADAIITRFLDTRMKTQDANDFLYAFDASRDYNPEPLLERIKVPLLAINSADDQVNPPELGIIERLMPRVAKGRFVLVPISAITRGHGTHTVAAAWKKPFAEFLASLPPLPPLVIADAPKRVPFEPEILAFEAADRASPPRQGGVVFAGSSTFRMWMKAAADFPGVALVNRGFGGSTFPDLLQAESRIVAPYRPHLIMLYEGDNDLNAGRTPADVLNDYRSFVSLVRRQLPSTRVTFVSIKPSPSRWAIVDKMREANRLVQQEVARDTLLAYVDVFTPMIGANGHPRPELFGPDSLHMTRAGYLLWRERLAPFVH